MPFYLTITQLHRHVISHKQIYWALAHGHYLHDVFIKESFEDSIHSFRGYKTRNGLSHISKSLLNFTHFVEWKEKKFKFEFPVEHSLYWPIPLVKTILRTLLISAPAPSLSTEQLNNERKDNSNLAYKSGFISPLTMQSLVAQSLCGRKEFFQLVSETNKWPWYEESLIYKWDKESMSYKMVLARADKCTYFHVHVCIIKYSIGKKRKFIKSCTWMILYFL